MSDDADIASEREEIARNAHIQHARRVIPIHERPVLGCESCEGITQVHAKETCQYYGMCITDWERVQKAQKISGKGEQ